MEVELVEKPVFVRILVFGLPGSPCFDPLPAAEARRGPRQRFDEATRPVQFALQVRAGADCLASMLRVAAWMGGSVAKYNSELRRIGKCCNLSY